jgi:hypothetical protein
MPPGHDDAGERILDLALYAPLGLVMSALEAMPDLVRKGRERLGPQVGMARTVGQFAVQQGYRQVAGFARSRGPFPFRPGQPAAQTYAFYTTEPPGGDDIDRDGGGDAGGDDDGTNQTFSAPALPASTAPPVGEGTPDVSAEQLAIPSYDSLSATQVVQRLTGLSRDEIAAVAAYEAATRQRTAILAQAEQLLM